MGGGGRSCGTKLAYSMGSNHINKFKHALESLSVLLLVILSILAGSESYNIVPQASSDSSGTPSGPQNLQATAGIGNVTLSWQAPSDNGGSPVTNYNIYRSTSSGTETLVTTLGNVTSYTNTGLTNGITYFYEVSAVNSVGESIPSSETSATPTNAQTIPSGPNFIIFISGTDYQAKDGATGTIVYSSSNATATIQNSIDALIDGGSILVKAGNYSITSTINDDKSNVTLEGEGNATLFREADGAN